MIRPDHPCCQLWPPRWMGDSTTPWHATGYQLSEAGRKGDQRWTRQRHTVEQVTMDNASEGMQASSWRTG